MNRLLRRSCFVFVALVAVGLGVFGVTVLTAPHPDCAVTPVRAAANYRLTVSGADTFGQAGLFIRRPEQVTAGNLYEGSVTNVLDSGVTNFTPTYQALVKRHDTWVAVTDDAFRIQVQADQLSVIWTLREDAPAATYGVSCRYLAADGYTTNEDIFAIVYTADWTYVAVQDNAQHNHMTDFYGGPNRTLPLQVTYNEGATILSLLEGEQLANGTLYGQISGNEVITAENFALAMTTVSGKTYADTIFVNSVVGNVVSLTFDEPLERGEIYILKFYSALDGRVYGQFIIDNSAAGSGINLSNLWILCVTLGGLMILVSVSLFFVPLIIVKVNENRVYKENLRIAKMKNPDAYVDNTNLWQRLRTKFKKLGKKGAKDEVKEVETPQLENAPKERKFTDMIRENREKRAFMEEHGISSDQVEAMQKQNAAMADAQKQGFAFLRDDDDDDEIASLYQEKVEKPTIETGAYVQDGVTFAKLDSMPDQPADQGQNG